MYFTHTKKDTSSKPEVRHCAIEEAFRAFRHYYPKTSLKRQNVRYPKRDFPYAPIRSVLIFTESEFIIIKISRIVY